MKHALLVLVLVPLFAVSVVSAQTLNISQATDGGGWQFTLVLTNTTTSNVTVAISFFKDTGSSGDTEAWTPPFVETTVNLAALGVPAGSSVFLHSTGTAAALTQGWAQITNAIGVEAYVIYTYTNGANISSGTAQGVISASGYLVPFDNTGTIGTELAVVNPTGTSETVLVNYRTSSGTVSSGSFNLPANGQMAFSLDSLPALSGTAGQSGLAEFYVTSGTLAIIALRSNTNSTTHVFSFTTAPVYSETRAPIISTSGTGGGGGGGGGGVPSGDISVASFTIGKTTTLISGTAPTVIERAGGGFDAFTPKGFDIPYIATRIGNCSVYQITYSASTTSPLLPAVLLDDGSSLSLSGPSLAAAYQTIPRMSTGIGPEYVEQLTPGTLIDGGTYNLSGTGGTAVLGFKTSATLPASFSTNLATIAQVDRSQPLTVTWTGTGFDDVVVQVTALTLSGVNVQVTAVACLAPASAGTLTVPTQALAHLPSIPTLTAGTGVLTAYTAPAGVGPVASASDLATSLTPNLVGGGKIEYGAFAAKYAVEESLPII
jgi:hypothetical protein